MIELICQQNQTLQQFADENLAQASFYFAKLLKEKEIKVNGVKVGENVRLQKGDIVRFYLTKKQEEKQAFSTVYTDENFIIVDKESGVNAEAVFAELCRKEGGRVAFIHRLDRNTMGLMAFARNERAERALLTAFQNRTVEKVYHALCFGNLPKERDELLAYLKKDEKTATVQIFDQPTKGAESIKTEYKILERRGEITKVEIILHTGKTHQIRAHFAHIRCPIVGDMKYGDTKANKGRNLTRQQLVAHALTFSLKGEFAYLNGKTFYSKAQL